MRNRSKKINDIFALDLGTTKFCLATIRKCLKSTSAQKIEMVSVPAQGMKKGMLADWEGAKTALSKLIEAAEKQLDCDITKVIVGVAGKHLTGSTHNANCELNGDTVSQSHVNKLVKQVEASQTNEVSEILHVIPVSFQIDDREPGPNPVGFSGSRLSGEFFTIFADRHYLKDVINLCNECGLEVSRLLSEPFASASVTVPDLHKELGVAVVDIGGGTTDGMVFQGSKPVGVFTVNVAGQLMTSDIAIGLNLPTNEAEKLKFHFGLTDDLAKPPLVVRDVKGCTRQVGPSDIRPILKARINELKNLIAQELYPFKGCLGGGLLLTGGGAEVKNADSIMETSIGVTVQRARPTLLKNLQATETQTTFSSKFSTVLGLLNLEVCRLSESNTAEKTRRSSRYLNQFVNWIKEMS